MFEELKKDLSSVKLLITLATIAVSIYLLRILADFLRDFSDVILIFVFGWLISFVLEPFVDIFTKYLKFPRVVSTAVVFVLVGVLITLSFMIFIPDIVSQFNTLAKVVPDFMKNSPLPFQKGIDSLVGSFNNYAGLIPSATQFAINIVTMLILSFYLVIDKESLNKRFFAVTPKKYHESLEFVQHAINQSFASFVRIQVMWGVLGGILTWSILTIFGVPFAASSSLMAGILTAVPMIGPIIGLIPPLLVTLIEKPQQLALVFLTIFIIQQIIFNVLGPKIIGKAFNVNPVIVMLALLIGIKIAGFTGAVFAVPVVSIILVIGKEFYNHYYKEKEKLI